MAKQHILSNLLDRRVEVGGVCAQVTAEEIRADPGTDPEATQEHIENWVANTNRQRAQMKLDHWGLTDKGVIAVIFMDTDDNVWFQIECEDGVLREMRPGSFRVIPEEG